MCIYIYIWACVCIYIYIYIYIYILFFVCASSFSLPPDAGIATDLHELARVSRSAVVFRTKILHVYGLDSISILLSRGEVPPTCRQLPRQLDPDLSL